MSGFGGIKSFDNAAIESAVENYLQDNPVGGLTPEQEAQIQQNTADINGLKPIITDITTTTLTQTMANNTEYRCGEMTNVDITLSQSEQYESSLVFSSGETATEFVYSDGIYWSGTDIQTVDGLTMFIPSSNSRYNISFWFDGSALNAVVRGVSI